jgi:PAS domain S-box-containing protein
MNSQGTYIGPPFLAGGGEMGELIRAKDWSSTTLGGVGGWPQSLRTTLSILLNSRFPMFLWWGDEMIQFYNDAYRPSLGKDGKHPTALGTKAADTWQEIWHIIKPLIDQVRINGQATWSEDQLIPIYRNGRLEDVYWTFGYSPVKDENDEVAGVLVVCTETTEKVQNYMKLQETKELYQLAIDGAELGTFDFNLLSNRYFMNARLREWLGLSPQFEIKDLFISYNHIAEEDKENVGNTLKNALDSSEFAKFDLEFNFTHPDTRESRLLKLLGQASYNNEQKAYRFNGTVRDTTREYINKNALEEKETNFRNLVMQAPVAMSILKTADYIVEIANPKMVALWGKPGEEILNKPIFQGLPETQDQGLEELLDEVYNTGITFTAHERPVNLPRNGKIETCYLNFIYEPLQKADGSIEGIMAVATDVTESVLVRHKISEAEERARMAIDASELGTYDLDLVNWEVICSSRFYEIFGLDNPVPYLEYIAMVHPDDMKIREQARRNSGRLKHLSYEIRIIRKDQQVRWVRFEGQLFFNGNKFPVRMMGTIKDITDNKAANEAIRTSEEKFRLLADNIPQMIWTADPHGQLNYFSHSVLEFSGLLHEQLVNSGWDIIHDDDRKENIRRWAHSIHSGEPFHFEHRFKNKDGEYRWQLSRAVPQKDGEGRIQMWVGTSTDIHRQKTFAQELESEVKKRTAELAHAARELRKSNDNLMRTNNELAKFAYVASHDLQEPLRKILTFSNIISESKDNIFSENGKHYFARMKVAALHMQQLIGDLLTYSRTNTPHKHFELTDMNELFAGVQAELNEVIVQKEAVIKTDRLPFIKVIPFQMEQLFNNMLINSLKFSKKDISPVITVKYKKLSEQEAREIPRSANHKPLLHHFAFSDNGIGFEPQYNERIFEVFQRLHSRDEYAGTGIGLSIIKKIVENHDGAVEAVGELHKGATFNIYLPA